MGGKLQQSIKNAENATENVALPPFFAQCQNGHPDCFSLTEMHSLFFSRNHPALSEEGAVPAAQPAQGGAESKKHGDVLGLGRVGTRLGTGAL